MPRHSRVSTGWIRAFGALLALATASALPAQAPALDAIELPPATRDVAAPGGGYVLVISTPDAWQSKRARAELFRSGDDGREAKPVWTLELPQEYGPRYAAVGSDGSSPRSVSPSGTWPRRNATSRMHRSQSSTRFRENTLGSSDSEVQSSIGSTKIPALLRTSIT